MAVLGGRRLNIGGFDDDKYFKWLAHRLHTSIIIFIKYLYHGYLTHLNAIFM